MLEVVEIEAIKPFNHVQEGAVNKSFISKITNTDRNLVQMIKARRYWSRDRVYDIF